MVEDDDLQEQGEISLDINDLNVCKELPANVVGEIVEFYNGKIVTKFTPTNRMLMDDNSGMIHAGYVFNAASYAAMAAINKKYSILIAADIKFLAPIELGHEVVFKAKAIQSDMKKCEVKVEGYLLDIKIFDSLFHIAIFDKKIFKLRFKDENK